MKQRQVLGRKIALVDLQLMNDLLQVRVAGFESRDSRGEIRRRRGT
jgi:hypothetical protein